MKSNQTGVILGLQGFKSRMGLSRLDEKYLFYINN